MFEGQTLLCIWYVESTYPLRCERLVAMCCSVMQCSRSVRSRYSSVCGMLNLHMCCDVRGVLQTVARESKTQFLHYLSKSDNKSNHHQECCSVMQCSRRVQGKHSCVCVACWVYISCYDVRVVLQYVASVLKVCCSALEVQSTAVFEVCWMYISHWDVSGVL